MECDMNEQSAICQVCGKMFSQISGLNRHLNVVHKLASTGEELTNVDKFICVLCHKNYSNRGSLNKHVKKIHSPENTNISKFVCEQCGYETIYRSSLKRHIKTHENNKKSCKKIECPQCRINFKNLDCLKRHQKKEHNIYTKNVIRKCPLCSFVSNQVRRQEINDHFQGTHGIKICWESHEFDSLEQFNKWKTSVEKLNDTYYLEKSKLKYFQCHKSGIHKKRKEGPYIRRLKSTGFCKINAFCPSEIKIKILENGHIDVKFMPCHVGHEGKSMQSLYSYRGIEKPLDLVSLESCIKDLEINKNIYALYYKPIGVLSEGFPDLKEEDFILIIFTNDKKRLIEAYGNVICIDSTSGLNQCNFQLFSLLVMDESSEGFPVSFMFTNNNHKRCLNIFFRKIKEAYGQINPKVFISAMDDLLYTEWIKVMGHPGLRLYSTWHVLKTWRINLKNREKIYTSFKTLIYELEKNKFHNLLCEVVDKYKNDDQTRDSFEDFEESYVSNRIYERWAHCYRLDSEVNTNMSLENFNKILRHCGLRGKNKAELENPLHTTLNFFNDKLFDMLVKLKKNKTESKFILLKQRHKSSLSLSEDSIKISEHKTWIIPVSISGSEFHTVYKIKACSECQLRCQHCETCFHEYICSCKDSLVRRNMCEHIHAVARVAKKEQEKGKTAMNVREDAFLIEDYCDMGEIIYEVCLDEAVENEVSQKQRLMEKLKLFTGYVNEHANSKEQMELVENSVDEILTALNTMTSNSPSVTQVFEQI